MHEQKKMLSNICEAYGKPELRLKEYGIIMQTEHTITLKAQDRSFNRNQFLNFLLVVP